MDIWVGSIMEMPPKTLSFEKHKSGAVYRERHLNKPLFDQQKRIESLSSELRIAKSEVEVLTDAPQTKVLNFFRNTEVTKPADPCSIWEHK